MSVKHCGLFLADLPNIVVGNNSLTNRFGNMVMMLSRRSSCEIFQEGRKRWWAKVRAEKGE